VQDLVVSEEWQGKGIGGRLMNEVVKRAKNQGVVVGLEASPAGEGLYRKLGFEMLGRYSGRVEKEEAGGGVMILRAGSESKKGKEG
jgi:GNAT superfamily N-acetyltransferase